MLRVTHNLMLPTAITGSYPRRIAYYKCVALVEGTNIVRRELGRAGGTGARC